MHWLRVGGGFCGISTSSWGPKGLQIYKSDDVDFFTIVFEIAFGFSPDSVAKNHMASGEAQMGGGHIRG